MDYMSAPESEDITSLSTPGGGLQYSHKLQ